VGAGPPAAPGPLPRDQWQCIHLPGPLKPPHSGGTQGPEGARARLGAFLLSKQEELLEQGLVTAGDSPFSLMEGLGGPACLFLDLASPEAALFPGDEL